MAGNKNRKKQRRPAKNNQMHLRSVQETGGPTRSVTFVNKQKAKRAVSAKRGKSALAKAAGETPTMRSSYGHTTAASSHILGGTSGSAAAHRHMMTFGDIKTSSFPKHDQPNQSMTPIARSVDSTSWVEVQQNSKSPKPSYMRAGEIAEAQNERYRQELI